MPINKIALSTAAKYTLLGGGGGAALGGGLGWLESTINAEWEGFKGSHHWDKLAFAAFSSELQSIYAKR